MILLPSFCASVGNGMVLLHEHQVNGADYKKERKYVVPVKRLSLEKNVYDNGEHAETYAFLYDLQLYQRERATVADEAYAVGRHLATILEQGYSPRKGYHAYERPLGRHAGVLQLKMPVPGERHENVAQYEQDDCI